MKTSESSVTTSDTTYPDLSYMSGLALRGGDLMRRHFIEQSSGLMIRQWKEDETPVTITDKTINRDAIDYLRRDYPCVSVIGEEERRVVEGARYTALFDPVDGTRPFSTGLPISTFCGALFDGREPILAVIYDPFMKRMWTAQQGKGAWLSLVDSEKPPYRLAVSKQAEVRRANGGLMWWRDAHHSLYDVAREIQRAGGHWLNPGSLAIYGGLIATGQNDFVIAPVKDGWETGAMQLIIEEAGGKATDIDGNKLVYDENFRVKGHIMSNGLIHDQLVEIVDSCQCRWRP